MNVETDPSLWLYKMHFLLCICDNSNSMVFQFSTSLAKKFNKNISFLGLNLLGNIIFGVETSVVGTSIKNPCGYLN